MSDVKCVECGDNLLKDELPETRAKGARNGSYVCS